MPPVIVVIDERLDAAGSSVSVAGHLAECGYELGEHSFALPDGIDYDLVLTNAGEGILASGLVRARVLGVCDRCLEEAEFSVASEVDEYFLFAPPSESELADGEDEADFSLVSPDNTIDLAEPIHAALLMETPFVVLCRDDCKGLCPVCGANLNEGECGCAERLRAERAASGPFAALASMKLD